MFSPPFSFREFKFEDKIENQMVGCIWAGKHLVTVSLNGNINYLDRENPSAPSKVVQVKIRQS